MVIMLQKASVSAAELLQAVHCIFQDHVEALKSTWKVENTFLAVGFAVVWRQATTVIENERIHVKLDSGLLHANMTSEMASLICMLSMGSFVGLYLTSVAWQPTRSSHEVDLGKNPHHLQESRVIPTKGVLLPSPSVSYCT